MSVPTTSLSTASASTASAPTAPVPAPARPRRVALIAWGCLLVAIVAEVVGTSFMAHAAREGALAGYAVMAGALALSYYFLALSVRCISVGVAYAVWEGLGLTLLTGVGVLVFAEHLSLQQLAGLVLAVVGIVCVTLGEVHA
ncbi:MAG: Spermidine export protein MdtJ [Stenotrophomonas maltophilia]|uniref:Spermidine export protein MdtJ n=1 Tax=Stenotrophomonas maltophilia TaxID=40324 RepID=A0A7V8FIU0_STEMA|nr:MAG: Spermidine export protein MdtJ [Stenotrophomonas maltophilia]